MEAIPTAFCELLTPLGRQREISTEEKRMWDSLSEGLKESVHSDHKYSLVSLWVGPLPFAAHQRKSPWVCLRKVVVRRFSAFPFLRKRYCCPDAKKRAPKWILTLIRRENLKENTIICQKTYELVPYLCPGATCFERESETAASRAAVSRPNSFALVFAIAKPYLGQMRRSFLGSTTTRTLSPAPYCRVDWSSLG